MFSKLTFSEEYGQYYGQMNTNGRMMTVKRDGLPYEEMGYCPPPNRKLPPVPGQHSNYNTIDRIKNGNCSAFEGYFAGAMTLSIMTFSISDGTCVAFSIT